MQEIYTQLSDLLKANFPDDAQRDEVIANLGELIMSEFLVELIEAVTDEVKRKELVEALNAGNQETVIGICESLNIDLGARLEDKAKQVIAEATA